jgi:RNA polymerase sigma factor (sigma-70 family)
VNTVFVELIENLRKYNEMRGSMATFVAVIARSTALDYCRSNKRKKDELIGDENIDFLSEPIEFEDKTEFQTLVKSIKEQLNEKEIVLFTMQYIYYYTPEEIAKSLNIRRNTVDKRVSRLRNKIKKFLKEGGINL